MKRRPPPLQTVPAPTDENLTYTITQTSSNVQSRRAPALIYTCHDARFGAEGQEEGDSEAEEDEEEENEELLLLQQ
jgi:hypothetical protein